MSTTTETTEHPAMTLLRRTIARADSIGEPDLAAKLAACQAEMATDPAAWRKHLEQSIEAGWLLGHCLKTAGETMRAAYGTAQRHGAEAGIEVIGEDLADLGELDESLFDTEVTGR